MSAACAIALLVVFCAAARILVPVLERQLARAILSRLSDKELDL